MLVRGYIYIYCSAILQDICYKIYEYIYIYIAAAGVPGGLCYKELYICEHRNGGRESPTPVKRTYCLLL